MNGDAGRLSDDAIDDAYDASGGGDASDDDNGGDCEPVVADDTGQKRRIIRPQAKPKSVEKPERAVTG